MLRIACHTAVRKAGSLLKHIGDGLHSLSYRIYRATLSVRDANVARWYVTQGTEDGLRYEFDVSPADTVIDVGGFEGDWAAEMVARYGCRVHVCEPVAALVTALQRRFGRNPAITIHPFGLAGRDSTEVISVMSESSSVLRNTAAFHRHSSQETIHLRDGNDFLSEIALPDVAVMKINIEGGEYDLLEALIRSGRIASVRNVLIQFHDFVNDAEQRMKIIQQSLSATHEQTFGYDFVWGNWRRI